MSDAAFLKTARARFDLAQEAVRNQRERELEDLKFYAGHQWDKDLLDSRKGQTLGSGNNQQVVPARPSLTINKTREPVRQVLNQERASDLGITLIPADDWGDTTGPIDHTEIELREGLVRRIQRDSEAADARTWAFSRAAIAGTGYYVVMTRFVPGKTWDQEVYIERLYNQSTVLLDPSHEQPDGSDAEWGFYGTDLSFDVYKSEHPSGRKRNEVSACEDDAQWRALGDQAPGWFTGDGEERAVRVMNYYYTERESKELALLEDGSVLWSDELPEGVEPKETRTVVKKTIKWAKIDGCQVLDKTDWPGHFLPIIKVVGEELQPYDIERRCEGIVRPMRDPCKGNNYIISKFVEQIGLTPIPPWMMAAGQDEGFESEYAASTTRTLPVLHYNLKDINGQLVGTPPQRTNVSTDVAALATGVQIFGQAIAATSVTPETALGNADPTVKSGKLAKLLLDQAERGTSNFLDNLVRSMRHEARVINDLLYPIYGRPGRLARMMSGQGQMSSVLIGQPFVMQGEGKEQRPMPVPEGTPGAKMYGLTPDADFNVAVKISKSFETRRKEIAETLAEIIGADPSQMAIIGDKLWKYFDLPDHEEIEKRYRVMLAPPIQQLLDGNNPMPPEAQQKIAMLEAQLQEILPLADKNKTDLEKTKIQEEHETHRMTLRQHGDDARTRADNETKLAVAELGAKMERLTLFLEERARLGVQMQQGTESELQRQHDREQADLERQQQSALADQEHQQSLAQAEQGQQHALEQGAMTHAQALEQQAQQPPPAGA